MTLNKRLINVIEPCELAILNSRETSVRRENSRCKIFTLPRRTSLHSGTLKTRPCNALHAGLLVHARAATCVLESASYISTCACTRIRLKHAWSRYLTTPAPGMIVIHLSGRRSRYIKRR